MHGNWDWYKKDQDWGDFDNCGNRYKNVKYKNRYVILREDHTKFHLFFSIDTLDDPATCTYDGCYVYCTNYTDVPQDLSPNVTVMYVSHKSYFLQQYYVKENVI